MIRKSLNGKIVSGRGRSQYDLNDLKFKLDDNLYPGSLNLVLNEPVILNGKNAAVVFDDGKRFLWEIKVDNIDSKVYAYRWKGTPLHIIELVSSKKLRNKNDILIIEIDNKLIRNTPLITKISWYIIWWRRQNWYYTNNIYKEVTDILLKPLVKMASQRNKWII